MHASNRKNLLRTRTRWVAGVLSVIAHGAVVVNVDVDVSSGVARERELPGPELVADAKLMCYRDVLLRAAARATGCATPFAADSGACWRDSMMGSFEIDLLLCDGAREQLDAAQVALVEQEELQRLKPKRLMDLTAAEEKRGIDLLDQEAIEKKKEAEKERVKVDPTAQVVEVAKPSVESRPDRARFVSEFDSQVEKETVARGSTEEMVARPPPQELPVAANPDSSKDDKSARVLAEPEAGGDGGRAGSSGSGKSLMAMRGVGDNRPSLSEPPGSREGAGETSPEGTLPREGAGGDLGGGEGGESGDAGAAGPSRPVTPNLRPTDEMLARSVGGGSVDKLDGVEDGDYTALNTKEWLHAPFFNRMKRQVARNWHPDRAYLSRDPTGRVYGRRDRVTVLQVSLKPSGELARVIVSKQSGVSILDDEAVQAFRRAQPFPNPPGALVDGEGLISFSFGFHFQVGSSPERWRVFRKL